MSMGMQFADVRDRLDAESLDLFGQMVEAHLEAGAGDKLFLRTDSLSGSGLIFSGGDVRRDWRGFNGGSLADLGSFGLLHVGFSSRGTENYRISADGVAFYRWLREQQGEPVAHVRDAVVELVDSAGFATRQPGASHHLSEAFALLHTEGSSAQRTSEIGDHLRKAIMDSTTVLLGEGAGQEQPIDRLQSWLDANTKLHDRERQALKDLVQLAASTLRLDHRLNHVRDEVGKGEIAPTFEEMRRAAFLTALVCYEVDRAVGGR
jgi:hypothetical protein